MNQETTTTTLDARGLNCPLPILRTRKAIAELESGSLLQVISSDPGSVKDIGAFCHQTGHELLESSQDGRDYRFLIRKQ